MIQVYDDVYFMKQAMFQAQTALEEGEIPVGAVIVHKNKIIARGYNMTEKLNDFTAHAEMLAFTSASEYFGNKYLNECSLYVTLEPCVMCCGASYWTRINKIVYAASDENRRGISKGLLHPKTIVKSGLMADEAQQLLQAFFKSKRE